MVVVTSMLVGLRRGTATPVRAMRVVSSAALRRMSSMQHRVEPVAPPMNGGQNPAADTGTRVLTALVEECVRMARALTPRWPSPSWPRWLSSR
jgi:hypothetical protein